MAEARSTSSAAAATITLTRRERVDFSLPTFVDGAAVMLPRDADPSSTRWPARRSACTPTTTEAGLRNTLAAKGMQAEWCPWTATRRGVGGAVAGEIDAYFGDQSILFGLFFASDPPSHRDLGEHADRGEARPGQAARRQRFRLAVDRAVSDLYRSGKMAEFFKTAFWGASPGAALQALFLLGPDMP